MCGQCTFNVFSYLYMCTSTVIAIFWRTLLFRRSLNLIETLLDLAEKGHYAEVMALFKVPMKQCPEVLFLGLLQCKVRIKYYQLRIWDIGAFLFVMHGSINDEHVPGLEEYNILVKALHVWKCFLST